MKPKQIKNKYMWYTEGYTNKGRFFKRSLLFFGGLC